MDKIDVKQLFVECRVDAPPAFFLLNVEFLNKKQECIVIGFFFYLGSTDLGPIYLGSTDLWPIYLEPIY